MWRSLTWPVLVPWMWLDPGVSTGPRCLGFIGAPAFAPVLRIPGPRPAPVAAMLRRW